MLDLLRRFSKSPVGVALFAIITIAFCVTLYEGRAGLQGLGGGDAGGSVATVGGVSVSEAEVQRRTRDALEQARQQQPGLDMATFAATGGVDQVISQLVNGAAIDAFADANGIVASKKLVDGAIASIAAFNGPTGQFDRNTFLQVLAERKLTEAQVRRDFEREAVLKMVITPVAGAARVPAGLVGPYAALLLEERHGQVALVPSSAFPGDAAVGDADLNTFYNRNVARYTVPERRTVRYALFDRARFDGKVAPSDAEIAAFYNANRATYAASETRGLTQVIEPTQAAADALAAKVRGGTPIGAAAKAEGREPLIVPPGNKAAFAKLTSAAVADTAFAAPNGGVAAIVKSGLGYHVVHVDSVTGKPARSLTEVRGEIATELGKQKVDQALADLSAKLDEDTGDGVTFDEAVRKYGLTAQTSPAVTASGADPDQPAYHAPPELQAVLREAFQAEADDEAAVATIGQGGSFAFWKLGAVTPAAPRPLAQIRQQVGLDFKADRSQRAAKAVADRIAAAVNQGKPLADAMQGAGVTLPAPKPAAGRRIDIARAGQRVPPPLALMFALAPHRARALQAANGEGWYVVALDTIIPGDARVEPGLIAATSQQLQRVIGDEYAGQFVRAISDEVGVKRNAAAAARVKAALSGGGTAGQ